MYEVLKGAPKKKIIAGIGFFVSAAGSKTCNLSSLSPIFLYVSILLGFIDIFFLGFADAWNVIEITHIKITKYFIDVFLIDQKKCCCFNISRKIGMAIGYSVFG